MLGIFTKLADLIVYQLLGFSAEEHLGTSLHFFIEDTSKIFALLVFMITLISFLRAGLDTNRIRDFLSGKNRFAGYVFGSGFGAITPFCSCSSIPLFLGFTSARIPLGITMAFLITSPMINEVAIILLGSLLGWKFMIVYVITGLIAGILGGAFLDALGAEKYLTPIGAKAAGMNLKSDSKQMQKLTFKERWDFALTELRTILVKVWKWVLIGVGIGALLHGFVPDSFIMDHLGSGQWWSVPAAVLLGIPLYANASGVIPVIDTLISKGLPVGTALAFMMSIVAASFPEFMMLKQVMKPRLLILFFLMLLVFFTAAGWIFNLIF